MRVFHQTQPAIERDGAVSHLHPAGQGGYALVALLALMTIMVLLAMSAAPNILQQNQREREREAIIRGEEVSEAIENYARLMNGALPTSMEQLLEGANPPGRTKKVRVLRTYAARDPLSEDGEWRLIQSRSKENSRFIQALMTYLGGRPVPPSQEAWKNPLRAQPLSGNFGRDEEGEDKSSNSNVPFIGVASRSRRESIIFYFGIDHHDDWLFTPIYR